MNPVYSMEVTIEDIHVDRFQRLKSSMLLYFAQQAAGAHCSLLGTDWDTLAQKNLFWALIRSHIVVHQLPTLGQRIRIDTWPMPTTRSAYPRAVAAYDENGLCLFSSTSLWVLMDFTKRSMVLPGKSGITVNGTYLGSEISAPGAIPLGDLPQQSLRTVRYSELDRNGHMNNTRYLDWVDDLLSSDVHGEKTFRELTLCYFSEAREGQQILLRSGGDDDSFRVDALRTTTDVVSGHTRVFSAEIHY